MRAQDLKALLDQLVARHNAQPKRALMTATPHERIAADWAPDRRLQILPRYPGNFVAQPHLAVEVAWATVRGQRAKSRTPYVQLDGAQYTNDILKQSWGLIGQKLRVEIRGDYRTVRAFRADGSEFGVLSVSGVWALSAHTWETRKEIQKLYRDHVFVRHASDPVVFYQTYLADCALQKTRGKRRPKITKEAGKLAAMMDFEAELNQDATTSPSASVYNMPRAVTPVPIKPRGRRGFFKPPAE